jgi:hypothetical protein
MESEEQELKSLIKVGGFVAIAVVFLLVIIFVWHAWTAKRVGKIILHSGVTYTGPTPTGGAAVAQEPQAPANGKFMAASDTPWKIITGGIYPYSFEAPETLKLVRFPNDQYDIYAIDWNNISPQSNVLIGVDNLTRNDTLKAYINDTSKKNYVENWWKQFGSLSGVSSVTPFTNSKGMKGYKAKFLLQGGSPAPYEDIFFETAKKKDIVIHLSNSVLDDSVFNRIVDTVSWGATTSGTKK